MRKTVFRAVIKRGYARRLVSFAFIHRSHRMGKNLRLERGETKRKTIDLACKRFPISVPRVSIRSPSVLLKYRRGIARKSFSLAIKYWVAFSGVATCVSRVRLPTRKKGPRRKSRSFREAEKFMRRYGMHKRWTGRVTSCTRYSNAHPRAFISNCDNYFFFSGW